MAPGIVDYRPSLNEQFAAREAEDKLAPLYQPQKKAAVDNVVHSPPGAQADIDWIPSFEKYQQRVTRRLKEATLEKQVPEGFPASVNYQMCWEGVNMTPSEYVYILSDVEIDEIEHALQHFKGLGLTKDEISQTTFPLPGLRARLLQTAQEVHQGRGFAVLRGLDPSKYSLADNVILYAGIASYIGNKRGLQDRSGNVLVHIKDVGAAVAPDDQRQSPYANNAQPFHNDLGDIIAMYVMDRPLSGGGSKIASTARVYNEIAATRPDLIHVLAKGDWAFDNRHEDDFSYHKRPILFYDEKGNNVFFCFSRRQLTGSTVSPRPPALPKLSESQAEALDAVHFTAAKYALTINLEKGDLQFVNNLGVFHSREAFTDGEENKRRHIIRMWLRNKELAWPTPEGLTEVWREIYGRDRNSVWYLNPVHTKAHVINRKISCYG
ncbi:Clavaminate synthase-like protein [Cenococcum geophilum 1.58]|uniref:Clavaminate synthase-like protein n=1 Tax=Cenococcum geophilum 1.58 TaxID=794803 RepID=UPI00358FA5F9|nr:Clavaminate synthase-like protein [Cenococcum geophilum 1.58]